MDWENMKAPPLEIGSAIDTPYGPALYLGFAFETKDGAKVHWARLLDGKVITYEEKKE